jgi:hypothetical protein
VPWTYELLPHKTHSFTNQVQNIRTYQNQTVHFISTGRYCMENISEPKLHHWMRGEDERLKKQGGAQRRNAFV